MAESLFFRLLPYSDKASTLTEAVTAVREGYTLNPVVHTVDPTSFRQVPGSSFAYWVSERIRRLFTELPSFESEGRTAKRGPSTGDDGRRVRTWWEVNPGAIGRKSRWVPFSKGGAYSPYYADIHLLVAWDESRRTFLDFWGRPGRMNERPEALEYFFRPGLTWPLRTNGLSFRAMTAGCVFGHKGPAAFAPDDSQESLLVLSALMNSQGFYLLVHLLVARVSLAQSFEVGLIQSIPIPDISSTDKIHLSKLARACLDSRCELDRSNETSHVFHLPALLQVGANLVFAQSSRPGRSQGSPLQECITAWQARVLETERQLAAYQREIDDIAFRLYGIEDEDRRAIEEVVGGQSSVSNEQENETESEEEEADAEATTDVRGLVVDLLSYALGCSFGRWDVHFAIGEKQAPELPDPFAPLPVCSPGMLTGEDGLPLYKAPPNYLISIDWDGILVDDPDHPDDIIRHIRGVLEIIWKERAEAIEHEACDILSVKDLRDYFRRPGNGGFWIDHVRRYSKSRRKAPIYWLLQSSKKNYALWVYYHRLDKDMLFKALLNYVEPKLSLVLSQLSFVRDQVQQAKDQGQGTKDIRKLEKEAERLESFVSELRDFEDKLRRATNLHLESDLNDGVVLNIAPLHELVPWKEAKNYWEELLAGKYEWSSIGKQLRAKGLVK